MIARLNKELTAAREALATLKPQSAPVAPGQAEGVRAPVQQSQEGGDTDSQQVIQSLSVKHYHSYIIFPFY